MTNRVQLAVRVPVDDVERYESYLREIFVQKHPYAGTELERELRTLREDNDLAALGEEIDRVVRAAGHQPKDIREKNILSRQVSDISTKPVNYRIDPDVREWFVHTYDEPGKVAGKLMRYIADGGTVDRLLRRFRHVANDAEALLADIAGDGSSGPVERRTRTLCWLLTDSGDGFTRDGFAEALDAPEVEGIDESDHTRQKYLPRVLDQLNYLPHPQNPDLFVPKSQAYSLGANPDGPLIDLWAPGDLNDDELTTGLQVELARDAAAGNGRAAFTTGEVQSEIFDGRLSTQKVASIMEAAAAADGFKTKPDNGKRIVAYLPEINEDVQEQVGGGRTDPSTPSSNVDPQGSTDEVIDPADVGEEMDKVTNATPVTDGGSGG